MKMPDDHLRVLHVVTGMGRGGAEKVAAQLAAHRGRCGMVAWLTGECRWEGMLTAAGCGLYPLNVAGARTLPRAIVTVARLIRRAKPDVVHTHLTHANIVGRFASRLASRVPLVSTEHGPDLGGRMPGLVALDTRTSRWNRAVVAVSNAVRAHRESIGYLGRALRVIYNGVQVERLDAIDPGEQRTVTMIGRLHPDKGPDLFIAAMERLPGARGWLVTHGRDEAGALTLLESSPARKRIRLDLRGVPDTALASASVVAVPSRREGLGLVALEAMERGKAVVASNLGGLPEVVSHGETGLLVPSESAEELASALDALLSDPERRVEMGRAARMRVLEQFTLERMVQEYDDLYGACAD